MAAIDDRVAALVVQVPGVGSEVPPDDPDGTRFESLKETILSGHVTPTEEEVEGPRPVVWDDQEARPSALKPETAFRWFTGFGTRPDTGWVNEITRARPDTPVAWHPGLCASHVSCPALFVISPEDEMPFSVPAVAREAFERLGGILLSAIYTLVLAGAMLLDTALVRAVVAAGGFVTIAGGFSAMEVGTVSVIGDSVPSSRKSAFVGLRSTAAGIGGVLGPSIVGVMVTVVSFETAFAIASLFAFTAALLVATKVEEPVRTTPPTTELQTIETSIGIAQLPGTHRGENAD